MQEFRTQIGEGGRVVIPATQRRELGIKPGDEVILIVDDGELRIFTPAQAVRKAQALVRRFIPAGTPLVDNLHEDRRRESEDE